MTKIREGYKETEIGLIPEDWEVKILGECANKILGGGTPPRNNPNNYNGDIPWITVKDMDGKFYKDDAIEYITDDAIKNSATNLVAENSVIVATRMGLGRGFINTKPVAINQDLKAIILKDDIDSKFFLFWYLSKASIIENLGTGTTVKGIRLETLNSLQVPLPKLLEQQRIAEILSTTDSHIEKIDKAIEDYKLLKKGMMKKLLTEGIGHTEFKETEIGRIPKAWEVKKLSEVVDVRDGTHDSPKQVLVGVPLITSKNLKDGKIDLTEITYISEEDHLNISKRSKVDKGDIIFAMIGTIGNPVIIDLDFEFSVKNVALLKFEKSELNNMFLKYLIDSEIVINQFNQRRAGGVQKFVSLGLIRSLEIPIPSTQEQKVISDIFSSLELQINNLKNNKNDFIELKKALMEKLLTGKIRVN